MARARELGVGEPARLLSEVDAVNLRQRHRTVTLARHLLGTQAHPRVAVLGGSFKAGTDDVRDSPALAVAERLLASGAGVVVHDPEAADNIRRHHRGLTVAASVEDACHDAALVVLATEWPQFAGLDPVALRSVVRRPVVLDARLLLDAAKWRAAGWEVHALGRSRVPAPARCR